MLPLSANAAFECNVKIFNVLVYGNGAVNVLHSGRQDYTVVCYLDAPVGGLSPTTCALWAAMLQAIKKKNGTAAFCFGGMEVVRRWEPMGPPQSQVVLGDVAT